MSPAAPAPPPALPVGLPTPRPLTYDEALGLWGRLERVSDLLEYFAARDTQWAEAMAAHEAHSYRVAVDAENVYARDLEARDAAQARIREEAVAAAKMWEDRYCRMNAARAAADERLAESRWLVSEARFFREKAPTSPEWERRAAAWLEGTAGLAAPQPTDPEAK